MASHDDNSLAVSPPCVISGQYATHVIAEIDSAFLAGDARCDITPLACTGLLALRA
jgi:hypothetical protein